MHVEHPAWAERWTLCAWTFSLLVGCADPKMTGVSDAGPSDSFDAATGDAQSAPVVQDASAPFDASLATDAQVFTHDAGEDDARVVQDAMVPRDANVSSDRFSGWSSDQGPWTADGVPPACPMNLVFTSPVPVSSVEAVLYPGQLRGTAYKPHGGFIFAPGTNTSVTVRAPLDGYVFRGARYVQSGEVQYMFDIIHSCGFMYRFDHLHTLSPRFQALADMLPAPTESSETTRFPPDHWISEGELIATTVGFVLTGNASFDWGVYDLRQRNRASDDADWLAAHPGEQPSYAVCWLDYLTSAESTQLRALRGGDGVSGKMSDYCL
jgi:hypothetical protein